MADWLQWFQLDQAVVCLYQSTFMVSIANNGVVIVFWGKGGLEGGRERETFNLSLNNFRFDWQEGDVWPDGSRINAMAGQWREEIQLGQYCAWADDE